MNRKVAIRRLTVLRNFMRSMPKSAQKHFYMGAWFRHTAPDDHDHVPRDKPITRKALEGCGTSACAAGWAATIPTFNRAGFRFSRLDGFTIEPEAFFGLRYRYADMLFYSTSIRTPKGWAKQADKVLKELKAA